MSKVYVLNWKAQGYEFEDQNESGTLGVFTTQSAAYEEAKARAQGLLDTWEKEGYFDESEVKSKIPEQFTQKLEITNFYGQSETFSIEEFDIRRK